MIPTATIDKIIASFATLTELCTTLTEVQWKTPTDCPGWSVQDLVSHLIAVEKGMLGDKGTAHKSPQRDYVKNVIGEHNENDVDARRHNSGNEILDEWIATASRRAAFLRTATDEYFDTEMMMPTGKGTIGGFLEIRLLDCWVHEQDIRRALNIPGNQSGPAAQHTIDRLIRTLPIVVGKRAAAQDGSTVLFSITGPVKREVLIQVTEGRANIITESLRSIDCTVSMDSNTFLTLATGRKSSQDLPTDWTTTGDIALGKRIVSQLNMMI